MKPTGRPQTLDQFPELLREWDLQKNLPLRPSDLVAGSGRLVWWRCCRFSDHEWVTSVSHRTKNGSGCPYCCGKKVDPKRNSLAARFPELTKQWHPTKNGDLKPADLTAYSNKVVWWKCSRGRDHQWTASPKARAVGKGCPICAGRRVVGSTSLATLFPSLAEEWNSAKNGDLEPSEFSPGSRRKVWWKCNTDGEHEWEASIRHRAVNKSGCPYCRNRRVSKDNSLAARYPELAAEWHPTKNGDLKPSQVFAQTQAKIWWKCKNGDDHEWQTSGHRRVSGRGCPFCSGNRVSRTSSLAFYRPDLADEWHQSKNGRLRPEEVTPCSNRDVFWQCSAGHEWTAVIADRFKSSSGCPECRKISRIARANQRTEEERLFQARARSLASRFPDLVAEWHPSKNIPLTPDQAPARSQEKVWWRCSKLPSHEWQASLSNRTAGKGCPFCSGHRVSSERSLAMVFPGVAEEWHPTKNGDLRPTQVLPNSSTKVWWCCQRNPTHEWYTAVRNRRRGGVIRGCPICFGTMEIPPERSLAHFFPRLAEQWHPTKNGTLRPDNVGPSSTRIVWWKCKVGRDHEWEQRIMNRTRYDASPCPFCSNRRVSVTNSLSSLFPVVATEWDSENNLGLLAKDFVAASYERVWWRCKAGPDHVWEATIAARTKGQSCPFCAGRRVSVTNCLAVLEPGIAAEWHPTKNGTHTALNVMVADAQEAWWKCPRGHSWKSPVRDRTLFGLACSRCAADLTSAKSRY